MTDPEATPIIEVLADDHAQTILKMTVNEPLSAEELREACGTSSQTVYRRLAELSEHDLVEADVEYDEDGHHYKVYRATLNRVVVDLTVDGLDVTVSRRDRMADRFTAFVDEVRDR